MSMYMPSVVNNYLLFIKRRKTLKLYDLFCELLCFW